MIPPFSFARPSTLDEAIHLLGAESAVIHGGGTDLIGCLRDHVFKADTLVSIRRLPELKGIAESAEGGLRIGAMSTITDIAEHPRIQKYYSVLAQAASEVGSPQLRNQGTIGGNMCQKPRCWYYRGTFRCRRKGGRICYAAAGENMFHCIFGSNGRCFIVHPSDTAPALTALNAQVETAGPNGVRMLAAENFHVPPSEDPRRETRLEPGEIVIAFHLPPVSAHLYSSYRKVRARQAWDFALAGVALALEFDADRVADARVVLSGAAPVPWRSKAAEFAIRGRALTHRTIAAAAEAVVEGAKPLAHNAYKLPLFRGVITEELERIVKAVSQG